jgi:hypothetical protein
LNPAGNLYFAKDIATPVELFRLAIAERKQVTCIYHGYYREACPHVLGWKGGHPHILAYQFGGRSSTGLPPGGEWCWLDIWQVQDARLRDGPWHTGQSQKQPESCVDRVAIERYYGANATSYLAVAPYLYGEA